MALLESEDGLSSGRLKGPEMAFYLKSGEKGRIFLKILLDFVSDI